MTADLSDHREPHARGTCPYCPPLAVQVMRREAIPFLPLRALAGAAPPPQRRLPCPSPGPRLLQCRTGSSRRSRPSRAAPARGIALPKIGGESPGLDETCPEPGLGAPVRSRGLSGKLQSRRRRVERGIVCAINCTIPVTIVQAEPCGAKGTARLLEGRLADARSVLAHSSNPSSWTFRMKGRRRSSYSSSVYRWNEK